MRLVTFAARLVRIYAIALTIAAVLIVAGLFDDERPPAVLAAVAIALSAFPPLMMFLFSNALRALAGLPGRVRAMPVEGRDRADELRRLGADIGAARSRGLLSALALPWRLTKLSAQSRELLTPYAPVLPLVSPPFLYLSALAAGAGVAELFLGLVALVDLTR